MRGGLGKGDGSYNKPVKVVQVDFDWWTEGKIKRGNEASEADVKLILLLKE